MLGSGGINNILAETRERILLIINSDFFCCFKLNFATGTWKLLTDKGAASFVTDLFFLELCSL